MMTLEHIEVILDKMFEISGRSLTYQDVKDEVDWYRKYTMTTVENKIWRAWVVDYLLKNRLVIGKQRALKTADWFDLCYGLKIDDGEK
jgi:hypothetical protein